MPQLIKQITGSLIDNPNGDVNLLKKISGEIGFEDFIKIKTFIAFLQNFTKVEEIEDLSKPMVFGLRNNVTTINLEISY